MKTRTRASAKVILLAFMMMSMTGLSGCDFCKTLGDIGEGIVSGIGSAAKWVGGIANDTVEAIGNVASGVGNGVSSLFSAPKSTTTVYRSSVTGAPVPRAAPIVPVVRAARAVAVRPVPEQIGLIPITDGSRVPQVALAARP
jgi:hypothetical protein